MTKQYIELGTKIINKGYWVSNERTNSKCLTIINYDLTYRPNEFPLITTRKSYWKPAIAELIGYIRGYSNAADFRRLGTKTWDANANNPAWTSSPYYKGEGDMGRVYGVQGRRWLTPTGGHIDQLRKVVEHLRAGIDDRGEIISFYNPGEFHMGCLRPCMYSHHFSLLGDTLYLNSTQRSCDVPLGLNFNMVQVYVFGVLMAQITGKIFGGAYHKIVNAHLYENQLELFKQQIERMPFPHPIFSINPDIKTLHDLETWVTVDDFHVEDYMCHNPIQYPFTV